MIRRRALLAAPALIPLGAAAQTAAPVAQDDTVGAGLRRGVLIRWGDRVTFDAPPFDPNTVDAEGASAQFGWDARIAAQIVPPMAADGVTRAVLAVAHPTVEAAMAFPGGLDRPEVAAQMQGASLLNLELQGGRWIVVDGGFQSRRLTASSLCRVSGPLAEQVGTSVQGVLGINGGAATPWASLLLAEGDSALWSSRLGSLDRRFVRGEGFGWLVELDPLDPHSIPVKRTAIGRFGKADAAAAQARGGQAVVYVAERGAGGYLFRFVSAGPARDADALDRGTLSVAQLQNARITWVPLPEGAATNPVEAARAANGMAFDAPSSLYWDSRSNRLLFTGGFGLLSFSPDGGDPAAPSMSGNMINTQRLGPVQTATVDARGRLLVGTDTGGPVGARAQTLWALEGSNATALYGAARAAGIGNAVASPDGSTIFTVARRPGAAPGATFDRPATRWPEFEAGMPPRSALLTLSR
ncbi:MAG: alkaline phosphatase PhoX [Roseococcus sp.]